MYTESMIYTTDTKYCCKVPPVSSIQHEDKIGSKNLYFPKS